MANARVALILIAALAAVYGYGALALVLLGQSDDALWPAVAGSAGSAALVGLRAQGPRVPQIPWGRWEPLLVSGQITLAAGLAAWAAATAALRSLGWPPDATLGASELACILATLFTWPAARRLARRLVSARDGVRAMAPAPGQETDPT